MTARRTTAKPRSDLGDPDTLADDPVPADDEEFRHAVIRRIATILRAWRTCRRPSCRRARRCAARTACMNLQDRGTAPAHERSAVLAHLRRHLARSAADPAERERGGR